MSLKLDKFTWSVVVIVALLLIGAVITVNMTGGDGYGEVAYLAENSPQAAVYNAFVANEKQDNQALDQYYTQSVLESYTKNNSNGRPYSGPNNYVDPTPRRLRILETKMQGTDKADVTVPAGTFPAWEVRLESPDKRTTTAWIGRDAPYPVVKFIDGRSKATYELTEFVPGS